VTSAILDNFMFVYFDGGRHDDVILSGTRGDQKVLQLGYKMLTFYIIHAVIFDIFSWNSNAYFHLLFLAVFALEIEFSVLTLRPCFHRQLAEQPMTCVLVHCHEKVKTPN